MKNWFSSMRNRSLGAFVIDSGIPNFHIYVTSAVQLSWGRCTLDFWSLISCLSIEICSLRLAIGRSGMFVSLSLGSEENLCTFSSTIFLHNFCRIHYGQILPILVTFSHLGYHRWYSRQIPGYSRDIAKDVLKSGNSNIPLMPIIKIILI